MAQNRFYSSLTKRTTTTLDPGTSGVTLTVADTTTFAPLDGSFPYTVLINWGQSDQEIVNVTARPSGTTFTIVRGQDGTTGQAHAIGATVDHGVSGRDFNEAGAHVGSSAGVHGVTGSVVGTSDAQTLSNKQTSDPFTVGGALTATYVNVAQQSSAPTSPAAGRNLLYVDNNGWLVSQDSAGARTYLNTKTVRLSADRVNSTTTPADVTDLAFPVESGGHYSFRFSGYYTTGATSTGVRLGLQGPTVGADGNNFWHNVSTSSAGTGFSAAATSAYDTHNQAAAAGGGSTFEPFWVEGELHAGAAGTLQLRVWSAVAASAATVKKNSLGWLWRID